jgi:flagellar biosynthesis/type III secretory pathway protein FliH
MYKYVQFLPSSSLLAMQEGKQAGFSQGIDQGINKGKEAGFNEGVNTGFQQGKDSGFNAGLDAGFQVCGSRCTSPFTSHRPLFSPLDGQHSSMEASHTHVLSACCMHWHLRTTLG